MFKHVCGIDRILPKGRSTPINFPENLIESMNYTADFLKT